MLPEPTPPFARSAEAALDRVARMAATAGLGVGRLAAIDAVSLLCERAALNGWCWPGDVSCAGACRLLPARDGVIAVNLPRDPDWELVPAWLESEVVMGDWTNLASRIFLRGRDEIVDRGRELGLAVSPVNEPSSAGGAGIRRRIVGSAIRRDGGRRRPPRVIDLSALWAGPLCTHLLERVGAAVIKVESRMRPDGARCGNHEFYGLLNQGKRSVALELAGPDGRGALEYLISGADIVVDASRPRALRQIGVTAEDLLQRHPGLTWISITGHGREAPRGDWIAFGDDAAAEGGAVGLMRAATGHAVFPGDAIADPLTGLFAAAAALESWRDGGGRLVELSLSGVVRHCVAEELSRGEEALHRSLASWYSRHVGRAVIAPARPRRIESRVARFGADNGFVLGTEEAVPC